MLSATSKAVLIAGMTQCGAREAARAMLVPTSGFLICSALTDLLCCLGKLIDRIYKIDRTRETNCVNLVHPVQILLSRKHRIAKVHISSIRSATCTAMWTARRAFAGPFFCKGRSRISSGVEIRRRRLSCTNCSSIAAHSPK